MKFTDDIKKDLQECVCQMHRIVEEDLARKVDLSPFGDD